MPVPPVLARRTRSFIYLRHPLYREGAQQPQEGDRESSSSSHRCVFDVMFHERPRKHDTCHEASRVLPLVSRQICVLDNLVGNFLEPRFSDFAIFFPCSCEQGNRPHRESQFCRNCHRDCGWSRCRSYVISVREFRTRRELCFTPDPRAVTAATHERENRIFPPRRARFGG